MNEREAALFRLGARACRQAGRSRRDSTGIQTVGELMAWLASRGEEYAHAFETPHVIRAAIDHRHVRADAEIKDASEIAFFPPMTGG